MPDTLLICTLRERRGGVGLSQTELAAQVGVSRQALGAIEAGRQVPSTTLALQLARALGCSVDDLFYLPGGAVVTATMAGGPRAGRRVVAGRVDGRLVAHPLQDLSSSADALLLGEAEPGEVTPIELLGEQCSLERNVLVAGCAPLLGVLAQRLGRRYQDVRATWVPANSARALSLLRDGMVHIAGVHLADASEPEAHVRAAQEAVPGRRAVLINLARWRQGLVVAKGNPLGLRVGPELLRPELRYVLRDTGAGAQRVLERVLVQAGREVGKSELSGPLALNHAEVAQLVRWGIADVGVAIEAAAIAQGLHFIPLSEERFDLILPESRLREPALVRFLDFIDQPAFRAEAAGLPGYDLSLAGQASTVQAALGELGG